MITIEYNGNRTNIKEATQLANQLLRSPSFYDVIKSKVSFDPDYTSTNATADVIANMISSSTLTMTVLMYLGGLRAYAYDDDIHPELIHINILHAGRSNASIVNTIIHEMVHAVNSLNPSFEFGHGDNSSIGKENSAPYWIGNKAEEIISNQTPAALVWEHDNHPDGQNIA